MTGRFRDGNFGAVCGRYASTRTSGQLADWFDAADDTGGSLDGAAELAPTDPVPIVRPASGGGRLVGVARWGLLPPWVTDRRAGARMINARAETVHTTPAYRQPFARRRCLVPADCWFEWCRGPDRARKQKYRLARADSAPLAFAGLFEPGSELLPPSCTIVTTAALGRLARVHDRMPLVLAEERWADWLDCEPGAPDVPPPDAAELVAAPHARLIDTITVSPVGPTTGHYTPALF